MKVKASTYEIPIFGWGSIKNRALLVIIAIILCSIYAITSDYNLATGTGNLSMVLFLAGNVYFPAKKIRLYYNIKNVQHFYNKLLVYHIWLNTFAFIVTCMHCYITLWSNNWLITALFIMGWLTFGGFLMWIKYQPGKVKKGIYILHTQQVLFFVMIFAMLKGHYVI